MQSIKQKQMFSLYLHTHKGYTCLDTYPCTYICMCTLPTLHVQRTVCVSACTHVLHVYMCTCYVCLHMCSIVRMHTCMPYVSLCTHALVHAAGMVLCVSLWTHACAHTGYGFLGCGRAAG